MEYKWTIGELAALFDVSTDTLRYYEKAGLLSSNRHPDNGYRYYSYDDMVILLDILLFRSMEVSVHDLRPVLTTMDIGAIKEMLQQNQQRVEEKLTALTRQKTLLAQLAAQYELCERQLGRFSLVPAPAFNCKFLGTQAEDFMEIIRQYKEPGKYWMHEIRYVLLLPLTEVVGTQSLAMARNGISLDESSLQRQTEAERQQFVPAIKGQCLYTVIGTDYAMQPNAALQDALAWLAVQGYQPSGALLGRYLASAHKDSLDYYEIWLPVDFA